MYRFDYVYFDYVYFDCVNSFARYFKLYTSII